MLRVVWVFFLSLLNQIFSFINRFMIKLIYCRHGNTRNDLEETELNKQSLSNTRLGQEKEVSGWSPLLHNAVYPAIRRTQAGLLVQELGLLAPPHPRFIHSTSSFPILQRRCRANNRYPMMQSGCQRRWADRGARLDPSGGAAQEGQQRAVKLELVKESGFHFTACF